LGFADKSVSAKTVDSPSLVGVYKMLLCSSRMQTTCARTNQIKAVILQVAATLAGAFS